MGIQKRSKINKLLTDWKPGAICTSSWLKEHGYSQQHLQKYKSSGWLTSLETGAYHRTGDVIDWRGGVSALQVQLNLPVHVGGKSALEMHSGNQYVSFGESQLVLHADPKTHLPKWFSTYKWDVKVRVVKKGLFDFSTQSQEKFSTRGLTKKKIGQIEITVSSPERAIFEYLEELPGCYSYSEALNLVENLPAARAQVFQDLLEHCTSVKSKRLFLHLAEKVGHGWFRRIDLGKVDLGSGRRLLFKNGEFDSKYLITVPKGVLRAQ